MSLDADLSLEGRAEERGKLEDENRRLRAELAAYKAALAETPENLQALAELFRPGKQDEAVRRMDMLQVFKALGAIRSRVSLLSSREGG